jgi:hypothetical protein
MIHKPGNPHRPRGAAPNEKLIPVTVKLDARTLKRLRELEEDYGPNIRGRTSAVLRLAIDDRWERIQK